MFTKTLLLLITLLMCLSAGARSVIRSHEEFVHMPEYQKSHHVIKLMELMVELEGKYKRETKKYGYSSDRFEKFQKAVQKITSELLINSAYARSSRPQKSWSELANEFSTAINQNEDRCIFAGWVSRMGPSAVRGETKKVCKHPLLLSNSESEKKVYPDDGCAANDTNQIQCNPVVFGYKKVNPQTNKGTLFCVSTQNLAENSSYLCMKAALGQTQNTNEVDSTEVRLNYLRTQLSTNTEAFNGVQKYVYKTCVCPKPVSSNFSTQYHEYLRPHQTCYGLMNMVSETVNCQDPRLPLDDASIFNSLRQFISTQTINSGMDAQRVYTQFITTEVINKSTATYNQLCNETAQPDQRDVQPEEPEVPEIVVVAKTYTCKKAICEKKAAAPAGTAGDPAQGADAGSDAGTATPASDYTCTYEVTEKDKTDLITNWSKAPSEVPAKDDDTTLAITGEIDSKEVVISACPLEMKAATVTEPEQDEKTFTVKITKEEEKTVTIKAEIKLKDEVVELGSSKWEWIIKEVPEGTTVKKGWEEEKKDEPSTPGRGGDTEEESEQSEGSQGTTPETPPARLEIVQERLTKTYKVCGKLDALPEQCVDVKPAEAKAPVVAPASTGGGATVPGGMPQAPIRGAADTSAIGIR